MTPRSTLALCLSSVACVAQEPPDAGAEPVIPQRPLSIRAGEPVDARPDERRLRNVRQLTFGGENAEAYWSFDGRQLIFQRRLPPNLPCDQIFVLDLATGEERMVSTGKGRTTCAYFLLGDRRVLYASTHLADPKCPPPVVRHKGRYVWAIYEGYDIFTCAPDGSDLQRLTSTPKYDAEATVCPVTGRLVFTSMRDGDLELYSMEPDGTDVQRLTDRLGYDGGAFFSHDGKKIVLRSGFFQDDAERDEYLAFLAEDLVLPNRMEITVIDRDGSDFRKVTDNGKANFAPYWHPDNRRILFSSNMHDERGRDFDIYLIHEDGTGLERITTNPTFDGFPMFSPDGKYLAFSSNRHGSQQGETNVFIAEWVEDVDR